MATTKGTKKSSKKQGMMRDATPYMKGGGKKASKKLATVGTKKQGTMKDAPPYLKDDGKKASKKKVAPIGTKKKANK